MKCILCFASKESLVHHYITIEQLYKGVAENYPGLTREQFLKDMDNPDNRFRLWKNLIDNKEKGIPSDYTEFTNTYGFNKPIKNTPSGQDDSIAKREKDSIGMDSLYKELNASSKRFQDYENKKKPNINNDGNGLFTMIFLLLLFFLLYLFSLIRFRKIFNSIINIKRKFLTLIITGFKSTINKIKKLKLPLFIGLSLMIIFLLFTNPTPSDFKTYLQGTGQQYYEKGIGRETNFLLFSIYKNNYTHMEYIAIAKNFYSY